MGNILLDAFGVEELIKQLPPYVPEHFFCSCFVMDAIVGHNKNPASFFNLFPLEYNI